MPDHKLPFVIGLTGGIGSGKSAVAKAFKALGIDVIDADQVSREVVAPGSAALQHIISHFGPAIVDPDGKLNRRLLRETVFADPDERQWLETLMHPLIRSRIDSLIRHSDAPWLILMVPLLLESGAYDFVNRVLVVDAPEHLQISRVAVRDDTSEQAVSAIMAGQMPRQHRLQKADDVLDNSGTLEQLNTRVASLATYYEELARDWHQAD